jgi:hypothetical protein
MVTQWEGTADRGGGDNSQRERKTGRDKWTETDTEGERDRDRERQRETERDNAPLHWEPSIWGHVRSRPQPPSTSTHLRLPLACTCPRGGSLPGCGTCM